MAVLSKLQQNRRVVQDFTVNSLAGIPGSFARLVYAASLRDLSSGRYEHQGLAALYPEEAVQQALELCHEQIFERRRALLGRFPLASIGALPRSLSRKRSGQSQEAFPF